jgi:hypothetical protein
MEGSGQLNTLAVLLPGRQPTKTELQISNFKTVGLIFGSL